VCVCLCVNVRVTIGSQTCITGVRYASGSYIFFSLCCLFFLYAILEVVDCFATYVQFLWAYFFACTVFVGLFSTPVLVRTSASTF
jgi:hypothetical protein